MTWRLCSLLAFALAAVLAPRGLAHAGPLCIPAQLSFAAQLAQLREVNGPEYGAGYEDLAEKVWDIEQMVRGRLPDGHGAPDYTGVIKWLSSEADFESRSGGQPRAAQLMNAAGSLGMLRESPADPVPLARSLRRMERDHADLRREIEAAIDGITQPNTAEAMQRSTARLQSRLQKMGASWGDLAVWCSKESDRIVADDLGASARMGLWAKIATDLAAGRGTPESQRDLLRAWKLTPRMMETELEHVLELQEWRVSKGVQISRAPNAPPPVVDASDEQQLAFFPEYRAAKGEAGLTFPPVTDVWETDPSAEIFYQNLAKTLERDKSPGSFALRVDRLVRELLNAGPEDRGVIRIALTLARRNSLERPMPRGREAEGSDSPPVERTTHIPRSANNPGPIPAWEAREVEEVRRALWQSDGNQSEAARLLGISRNPFLDKLRRYGAALQDLGKGPEATDPRPVRTLDELYREAIVEAFVAARGNRSQAADWLGLDRSTVSAILNGTARGKYAIELAKPPIELPPGFQTLETREREEIVKGLALGRTYQKAAKLLGLSPNTLRSRMGQYGVSDSEAAAYRDAHGGIVVTPIRGLSYDAVQEALRVTGGVKTRAAEALGIDVQRIDTILKWGPKQ